MAQETGKGTFHKQTELFLRNWICAGNSANYTSKGRAYNPMSGGRQGLWQQEKRRECNSTEVLYDRPSAGWPPGMATIIGHNHCDGGRRR